MKKTGKGTGKTRRGRKPRWIGDVQDQRNWNRQFVKILKRDYADLDPAIAAILRDEELSHMCATKIRSYVDKEATSWWYAQSKARGAEYKKKLDTAIAGLHAASDLGRSRGDREPPQSLNLLAEEYSQAMGRCKQAFATKPHGRDRDHSFLLECHSFLRSRLRRPVTYKTIANLVNAGFEADGKTPDTPITEEQVRKNEANFKRNNPHWRLYSLAN